MPNTTITYYGKYGVSDGLDNPAAIIRMIDDAEGDSLTIEICNPGSPWREDNELMRYVWGLSDGSYPLDAKIAVPIISTWKENWPI